MRQIDHVRAGSPRQSDPFGRVLRNPAVLHMPVDGCEGVAELVRCGWPVAADQRS
jgi:hypothetical protein